MKVLLKRNWFSPNGRIRRSVGKKDYRDIPDEYAPFLPSDAVIVEDEEASRETLCNYLAKYCPDVEVVGMGESVKSGLEAIKANNPDLVFLDVEMPYGNAFDLLEQIGEPTFETIFVTAYSNYAVKAINFSAS